MTEQINSNPRTNTLGMLMKKLFLALPFLCTSLAVSAQSYITIGYGAASISHDEKVVFGGTTAQTLIPEDVDPVWNFAVGFRDNDAGLELGYSQFNANASTAQFIDGPTAGNGFLQTTDNWMADLKAKQFFLKPIRFYDLNENFTLKLGIGLTYTKYDITGSSQRNIKDPIGNTTSGPLPGAIDPSARTEDTFGGVASIGFDYVAWKALSLGLEANISYDNIATTTQFLGTIAFRF